MEQGCNQRPTEEGFETWERLRPLGDGHLGSVFLARRTRSDELVALKTIEKAKLVKARRTERLLVELAVLRAVAHPFIIGLVAAFQDERWAYLALELCTGGDLFELVQRQPFSRLPEAAARFYVAEICVALQWLHLHGVIYRDLKMENVLIAASGHVRVADFDLAAIVPRSAPMTWQPAADAAASARLGGVGGGSSSAVWLAAAAATAAAGAAGAACGGGVGAGDARGDARSVGGLGARPFPLSPLVSPTPAASARPSPASSARGSPTLRRPHSGVSQHGGALHAPLPGATAALAVPGASAASSAAASPMCSPLLLPTAGHAACASAAACCAAREACYCAGAAQPPAATGGGASQAAAFSPVDLGVSCHQQSSGQQPCGGGGHGPKQHARRHGGPAAAAGAGVAGGCAAGARLHDAQFGTIVGTLPYLAPEVLTHGARAYGAHVDWWALGCLLYELLFGQRPFSGAAAVGAPAAGAGCGAHAAAGGAAAAMAGAGGERVREIHAIISAEPRPWPPPPPGPPLPMPGPPPPPAQLQPQQEQPQPQQPTAGGGQAAASGAAGSGALAGALLGAMLGGRPGFGARLQAGSGARVVGGRPLSRSASAAALGAAAAGHAHGGGLPAARSKLGARGLVLGSGGGGSGGCFARLHPPSAAARSLVSALLCKDPRRRLGTQLLCAVPAAPAAASGAAAAVGVQPAGAAAGAGVGTGCDGANAAEPPPLSSPSPPPPPPAIAFGGSVPSDGAAVKAHCFFAAHPFLPAVHWDLLRHQRPPYVPPAMEQPPPLPRAPQLPAQQEEEEKRAEPPISQQHLKAEGARGDAPPSGASVYGQPMSISGVPTSAYSPSSSIYSQSPPPPVHSQPTPSDAPTPPTATDDPTAVPAATTAEATKETAMDAACNATQDGGTAAHDLSNATAEQGAPLGGDSGQAAAEPEASAGPTITAAIAAAAAGTAGASIGTSQSLPALPLVPAAAHAPHGVGSSAGGPTGAAEQPAAALPPLLVRARAAESECGLAPGVSGAPGTLFGGSGSPSIGPGLGLGLGGVGVHIPGFVHAPAICEGTGRLAERHRYGPERVQPAPPPARVSSRQLTASGGRAGHACAGGGGPGRGGSMAASLRLAQQACSPTPSTASLRSARGAQADSSHEADCAARMLARAGHWLRALLCWPPGGARRDNGQPAAPLDGSTRRAALEEPLLYRTNHQAPPDGGLGGVSAVVGGAAVPSASGRVDAVTSGNTRPTGTDSSVGSRLNLL